MLKRLAAAAGLFLAATLGAQTAPAPVVKVTTDTEAKELAQGFAQAAASLNQGTLSVALERDHVVRVIEDVRTIKATEGVLVVIVSHGPTYLVNPKDVVYITDGAPLKP